MAFELMADRTTAAGHTYVGKAEKCVYEIRSLPEQVPGESYLSDLLIERNIQELEAQGVQLLRIRIFRDVSPTWHTDYRLEVWATASPILWTPVILIVLGVFALIISWRIISEVKNIDWGSINPVAQIGFSAAAVGIVAVAALALWRLRRA